MKANNTPDFNLEDKPVAASRAVSKPASTAEPSVDADTAGTAPKAKPGTGNTAKLGCSPAARDHIESLVKKLTTHGVRIDAATFVNELIECFGQAGGYIAFTRRAGTFVSAKVVVEERIEGMLVPAELPVSVAKRQQKNPFAAAIRSQAEVKV